MQTTHAAFNKLLQFDHTLQSVISNPQYQISPDLTPSIATSNCLQPKQVVLVASTVFNEILSSPIPQNAQDVLTSFKDHLKAYIQLKDNTALKSNSLLRTLLNKIERCIKVQHMAEEFECIRIEMLSKEDTSQKFFFADLFQAAAHLTIEKIFMEKMLLWTSLYRQKQKAKLHLMNMEAIFEYLSPFKAAIMIRESAFNVSYYNGLTIFDALYVSKKMCSNGLSSDSEIFRSTYKTLLNEASTSKDQSLIQFAKMLLEYREVEERLHKCQIDLLSSEYYTLAESLSTKYDTSMNLIREGHNVCKALVNLRNGYDEACAKYRSKIVKEPVKDNQEPVITFSTIFEHIPFIEELRKSYEFVEKKFHENVCVSLKEYCEVVDKKISVYELIMSSFARKNINLNALVKSKKENIPYGFTVLCEKGFKSSLGDAKSIPASLTKNITCITDELQYAHNFHKLEVLTISKNESKNQPQSTKKSTTKKDTKSVIHPSNTTSSTISDKEKEPIVSHVEHIKPTVNELSIENRLLTPIYESSELVCAWHVSRWYTPEYNPFIEDYNYARQKLNSLAQQIVRIKHSFPLAFAVYVKQNGFQSEYKDPYTKISYDTFTVGAEYEISGSAPVHGKLTLGYSKNGVLCHNFFTANSSTSYIAEYITEGKLNHEKEELDKLSLNQQATSTNLDVKLLDDSYITLKTPLTITERFVTADIESPLLGKITFRIFFLLGAHQIQLESFDHIPNGTFVYQHN